MKVNLDDPNLTAFALGELSPHDHAKMAQAVAASPEAQSHVAETQHFARLLRAEYEADRQQPANDVSEKGLPARSPNMVRMEEERRSWSRYQWGSLAAVLAISAVIAAVAITIIQRESGTLS
jgi:anti-sigma factor RsiW